MIEKTGDLIERDWLLGEIEHDLKLIKQNKGQNPTMLFANLAQVVRMVITAPKVPAIRIPCVEGDTVWMIRRYYGIKHPQQGVVSELMVTRDLRLMITVKHIGRGEWGKEIFRTYQEADDAIRKQNTIYREGLE